jgi:hypothetical protein
MTTPPLISQAAIDEVKWVMENTPRARDLPVVRRRKHDYGTPEWERRHVIERCRSRGVEVAVYDFIAHNMGHRAASAALDAKLVVA